MNPAILVALATAGGAAAAYLRNRSRAGRWVRLAQQVGGTCHDLGPLGVEILPQGDLMPVRVLSVNGATRFWSAYPAPFAPRFLLASNHLWLTDKQRQIGGKLLGFAGHHDVYTNESERTSTVLDSTAREWLITHLGSVQVLGNRRIVELHLPALSSDMEAWAALRVVARATSADLFGVAALRSLPGAKLVRWPSSLDDLCAPVVTFEAPARVNAGPVVDESGLATEVWSEARRGQSFRSLVSDNGALAGPLPKASIPPAVARHLGTTGRGLLIRTENEVRLRWPGLETNPARLLAAGKLVAAFNDDSAGPAYR